MKEEFISSLFFSKGGGLHEGYLKKIHNYNLYNTCLRPYSKDFFVKKNITDKFIIEKLSEKLNECNMEYSIEFNRSMRLTGGKPNGYYGLKNIYIKIYSGDKVKLTKKKEKIKELVSEFKKEVGLPINFLNKEEYVQIGGTNEWKLTLFYRCVPRLLR
jgi:hypothetical protein